MSVTRTSLLSPQDQDQKFSTIPNHMSPRVSGGHEQVVALSLAGNRWSLLGY